MNTEALQQVIRVLEEHPNVIPIRDFKADTGYRWREKDEVLDLINSLIDKSGESRRLIANRSFISYRTLQA